MTTRATVTQASIARAIRAALDNGLTVAEVLIEPDCARVLIGKKPVAEIPTPSEGPQPRQWPKA